MSSDNAGWFIIGGAILFIFAAIALGALMENTHGLVPPIHSGTILPCDKVVSVSEKYTAVTDRGISRIIVVNGNPVEVRKTFALDGGESVFNSIPTNTSLVLFGSSGGDVIGSGGDVIGYEVVSVVESPDIRNGCVVQ